MVTHSKAYTPPLPHLPAFRGHSISDKISVLGVYLPNDGHSHHFQIFAKIFTIRNTELNIISWKNRGIHTYFLNSIGQFPMSGAVKFTSVYMYNPFNKCYFFLQLLSYRKFFSSLFWCVLFWLLLLTIRFVILWLFSIFFVH